MIIPKTCSVELRDRLSKVPASDRAELVALAAKLTDLATFGPTTLELLQQLLLKLGSDGTNKVVRMFSHGDNNVEADGFDLLQQQIESGLGVNGKSKLLLLFKLIHGKETFLLQLLGEYLCANNSIDFSNWPK